jgi:peptidoglycan/LPS O-acetylase OafA/YrhL
VSEIALRGQASQSTARDFDQLIGYRAEIDGLRAIAVVLVILAHAFPDLVPNGFVGVDIFFVISGFLITGILLAELRAGRFSVQQFYVRRVNRIFPALIVVLVACLGFGALSLYASEFKLLGRSTAWSAGFAANVNFYLEVGYWDISAKLKPLLHLWSLGIEEQFYLLWPLVLWAIWRLRRYAALALAILISASFAWNLYSIMVDHAATFYLPFSRFWELLAGGALAWAPATLRPRGNILNSALAVGGFALIAAALIERYPENQFPGAHAAIPVLGTVLVIAAGSDVWLSARVLAHPSVVYVGLISYPLYLWHWPALTFARILDNGTLSAQSRNIALASAFVLAATTYHLIERPIRTARQWRERNAVVLACLLATCGVFGYWVFTKDGLSERYQRPIAQDVAFPTSLGPISKVAVVGDSQAEVLIADFPLRRDHLVAFMHAGWPYLAGVEYRPGLFKGELPGTPKGTDDSLAQLISDRTIDAVVIAHMNVMYTDQESLRSYPIAVPGETSAQVYEQALRRTVELLAGAGKRVIYVKSIPTRFDVPDILACSSPVLPIKRQQPAHCVISAEQIRESRRRYDEIVRRALDGLANVYTFDQIPFLCDEHYCYIERNGVGMYRDTSHLSKAGSALVGVALAKFISGLH